MHARRRIQVPASPDRAGLAVIESLATGGHRADDAFRGARAHQAVLAAQSDFSRLGSDVVRPLQGEHSVCAG